MELRATPQSGFRRLMGSGAPLLLPPPLDSEQFIVNLKYPSDSDLKPIDELSLDVYYGI